MAAYGPGCCHLSSTFFLATDRPLRGAGRGGRAGAQRRHAGPDHRAGVDGEQSARRAARFTARAFE